jgi:hypothetical protein
MPRTFRTEDEGKRVVSADGERVGTCQECRGDTARVEPETDLAGTFRQRLGWPNDERETYRLSNSLVDRVGEEEIRLRRPPNA